MFVLKFISFIALLVYCTKSDNVSEKLKENAISESESSTKHNDNDKTSVKINNNIPVAVVFEEETAKKLSLDISSDVSKNVSKNDRINQNESKSNREMSDMKTDKPMIMSDNYNKSTKGEKIFEYELMNITDSVSKDSTLKKIVSDTETEIRIPVAVIYDPEPENLLGLHKTQSKQMRQSRRKDVETKNRPIVQTRATLETQSEDKNMSRKLGKRTRERDPVVPIVQSENYVFSHNGAFHYSYEGGDGTKAFEKGELKSIDDNTGESVVGSFSYVGKDGNEYSLTYTADENGYRPVGAHLPTPPPIPPAIARALKYLATKSTSEPVTEALK